MSKKTKEDFIRAVTSWLMPGSADPELTEKATAGTSLDGVYSGKSLKIKRLIYLAYLRGVRKGALCAWEAQQPIVLRDSKEA